MAATLTGALTPIIEAALAPLTVFRDDTAEGETPPLPRVTILEAFSSTPERHGDSELSAVTELFQVSLFQQWRDPVSNVITENYALPDRLAGLIHGQTVTIDGVHVYGLRFISSTRFLERAENVIHHAFTFWARRSVHTS